MSAAGPGDAGAIEGASGPHSRVEPSGTGGSGLTGVRPDALTILARELYWAGDPAAREVADTGSVRERLHSFAHRLRIEARELYPSSESGLDRSARLRRRTKRGLWYVFRFATLRYDRLLAELAELNVQLADRLAEAERELQRTRDRRQDREPDA